MPTPTDFAADFADAHRRHWQDAELLYERDRWANADHLYGFSAECGLKAVLEAAGQPIQDRYRTHVDELWREFVSFAEGRMGAARLSMLPPGEPFRDWNVSGRYAHRRHFDAEATTRHRDAARKIRDMVERAIQGGRP